MPAKGYGTVTLKDEVIEQIDQLAKPGEQRPDVIKRALSKL
jgi:hypothetical protein